MASGGARDSSIKVICRFRPQNKIEIREQAKEIVSFHSPDTCEINSGDIQGTFTFDRVFDMACKQTDIFDFSIRPTVDDILNGYNGTVFAYGQTGAGKSFTMMGADIDSDVTKGIIPRIVEQIFASILASPGNIEYTVRVSYMEIYMEKIRDLLAPQNDNLPIHEEKNRGIYVKGLLEIYVSSVQEVYEVMRRGGNARAVSATNMNQESSRSHSIFVITVTQKNVETGSAKSGQLFLVDLAGSEKVGKTGASGQTLEEAKKINKSLSALGNVINSLTDGKSQHIPYRDSKLTRILQESLGGNSRTTLIICASPSSYNDAETVSTLRFGVRAKAIKNKAKINAELSPAELKALLRKAQQQMYTFQEYVSTLEGEVSVWRSGETVPKDKWVAPTPAVEAVIRQAAQPASATQQTRAERGSIGSTLAKDLARPSTPARFSADVTPVSPGRPDSRADLMRSATPTVMLDKDEKEEFLKRENELQDQIAEKESQAAAAEKLLAALKEELAIYKEKDKVQGKDNEKLTAEVSDLKMNLEKVSFESKEALITMDGLKEANLELTAELDEVKQHLLDVKVSAKEATAAAEEKERRKAEKMAKMMAGFDLGDEVFSENERLLRSVIENINGLVDIAAGGDSIPEHDLREIKTKLQEAQGLIRQTELNLSEKVEESDAALKKREELEKKFVDLEKQYRNVLENGLEGADVEDIRKKLEETYTSKREVETQMLEDLKVEVKKKAEENEKLKKDVEEAERKLKAGAQQANGAPALPNGKTVAQQIAEFDQMKKSLMRDLQNRCERVVELEISLDETREQYNNVLRSSNNRAQQKKMAFLERNLEQLTHVQRQLVEQNSSLKKEVAIAERKLVARNERIQSLEQGLRESQDKLTDQSDRFEAQLTAVKERLQAAKIGNRDMSSPTSGAGFSFSGSRIAKPLRGGGGGADNGIPIIGGFMGGGSNASEAGGKRSTWSSIIGR
ncbi:Kinesin heavy chain [Orbilia oligospora]|uniref:Kinesin-like protein n=1 Tax=Orbilia oligospora TaxID=2813651 RepID=A0A6G1M3P3_ORBOL|nr:Kinesin heavy chain [Orbilia oligospora]KAF3222090.1 Kinesin heavy chain [Orbilia oligospora]KAF3227789.1 Kinesin heavy chain [Orbilia oligospora]KAF3244455.1 Kinesin heavy chain [Orbilia oligospora]